MLNHFQTMVIFALAVSLAFAFLSKQRALASALRYFLWAFLAFLVVAIGIGWLMYPVHPLKIAPSPLLHRGLTAFCARMLSSLHPPPSRGSSVGRADDS